MPKIFDRREPPLSLKRQPGSLQPVVSGLAKCQCGSTPQLVKIGEWPAQYRVECQCGKAVLGRYYSHHEAHISHDAKDCHLCEVGKRQAAA